MKILNQYEHKNGLSICFCILHYSKDEEQLLFEIQKEMSESVPEIRQSYVYGDQTVNATEFSKFRPDYYTKAESSKCSYPAHEALALAAGMIRKELDSLKNNGIDDTWRCLLLILGEKSAMKQRINGGNSYETVKQWVMGQEKDFDVKVVS